MQLSRFCVLGLVAAIAATATPLRGQTDSDASRVEIDALGDGSGSSQTALAEPPSPGHVVIEGLGSHQLVPVSAADPSASGHVTIDFLGGQEASPTQAEPETISPTPESEVLVFDNYGAGHAFYPGSADGLFGPGHSVIDESGEVIYGPVFGTAPLGLPGSYFWVRYDFGDWPGTDDNYGSLGTFLPITQQDNGMLFADAQMMIYEDDGVGADVALGYRYLHEPTESIIGVNAFYTHDRSPNAYGYDQFGFGFEWLWKLFDVRANAYLPFDNEMNPLGAYVAGQFPMLRRSTILFVNTRRAEQQMGGGDVEVGFPIPGISCLRGYAGAYFYEAEDGESLTGFRGRLGLHTDSLEYYISLASDDVFGTNIGLFASLYFGRGGLFSLTPFNERTIDDRMYERTERQHRVAVARVTQYEEEEAINPATGLPYVVVHVDNSFAGPGTGTIENRFTQLDFANGTNADYILVWRGNTSRAAPLVSGNGLIMSDDQYLLGENQSQALTFEAQGRGTYAFPNWGTAGTSPFVGANDGHPIVTLANDDFVYGLNLISPQPDGSGNRGSGITGNGINNFTIREINRDITSTVDSGPGRGIYLTNASGTGVIENVRFNIPNVTATGAIVVENTNTNPLSLTIDDAPMVNGGAVGVRLRGVNSNITATVNDVIANGNGSGLEISGRQGGTVTATVTDSTFNNAANGEPGNGHGVRVFADTGTVNMALTNVTATGSAVDGLHIEADTNSTVTGTVTNSSFSNATRDGIHLDFDSGSTLTGLTVSGTPADNAGRDGLHIEADDLSVMNVAITDGSFLNAGEDAFDVTVSNSSTVNLTVDPTPATGANQVGLRFDVRDSSQFNAQFTDTDLSTNLSPTGSHGIEGTLDDDATVVLTFTDSQVASAGQNPGGVGGDGLNITAGNGSLFVGTFTDGSFVNADQNGVVLDIDNAAASLTLDNTNANDAGNDGLQFDVTGGGILAVNLNNGIALDTAGRSAIYGTVSGLNSEAVVGDIAGSGVSGSGANEDAIHLEASNQGTVTLVLPNAGSFANAGTHGLNFVGNNGTLNISIAGTTASPASFIGAGLGGAGNGVNGLLSNGATANLTLTDTSFAQATDSGLSVTANSNSTFVGAITRGSFSEAQNGHGVALFWDNSQNADLDLTNVTIDDVAVDAFHVEAANASTLDIDIIDSSLTGAGEDAYDIAFDGGSTVDLFVDPTPSTGASQVGFRFAGTAGSNLIATFDQSDLSTAADPTGLGGILGTLNASSATLTFTNSQVASAGGDGLNVSATNGSAFTGSFTNGSFASSAQNGLSVSLDNSVGSLTLSNTAANNAQVGNGLVVAAANGSTFTGNVTDGSFANAGLNGVAVTSDNSTANLTLSGTNANNAGANGVQFDATNGGVLTANLGTGMSLDNATNSAIRVSAVGTGSQATVTGDGVSGTAAGVDAISLQGTNGGQATLNITNAGSFASAGNDGIALVADGGTVNATLTSNGALSFANSGQNAIDFNANSGGQLSLSLTGTAAAPVSLDDTVTGSAILGSVNNATATLDFDYFTANGAQGAASSGLDLTADNDGTIIGAFDYGSFDQNGFHGVEVSVNPDLSTDDNSLINLFMYTVTINDNTGDGINVVAANGNDDATNDPNNTGAIITVQDGEILRNGNGTVPDELGNGIDATATGDNTVAGNTQITLNIIDTTIEDNEEDQITTEATEGGTVNLNFSDGSIAGEEGIVLCATDALSLVRFRADGITVDANPDGPGLTMIASDGGIVDADISNVDFNNNGAQGILFAALNGGQITADLTNINVMGNDTAGLATINLNDICPNAPLLDVAVVAAVQGIVDGADSSAEINMTELNVTANDTLGGFDVAVTDGGSFTSTITDTTISGNAASAPTDEFYVLVEDADSNATFNIDGLDVSDSEGRAMAFEVNNADFLSIDAANVTADNATGAAVEISLNNVTGENVVTLDNVSAQQAAGGSGLSLNGTGLTATASVAVTVTNSDFSHTGTTAPTVDADAVNISLAGVDGSAATIELTDVTANDSRDDGVEILLDNVTGAMPGGASSSVSLTHVVAQDAQGLGGGGQGLNLDILGIDAGATVDVNISGNTNGSSDFSNAATDGVGIVLSGDATATSVASLTVDGLVADNAAAGTGVDIVLQDNLSADITRFNNVTATNAFADGLHVDATAASVALREFTSTEGVDVSNAGGGGAIIELDTQTAPTDISITGLTASNDGINGTNGVNISLVGVTGGDSTVALKDVTADDVGTGQGVSVVIDGTTGAAENYAVSLNNVSAQRTRAGEGLNVDVTLDNGDDLELEIQNGSNFSYDPAVADAPLNTDAVRIAVTGPAAVPSASATISIGDDTANDALTANYAGGNGVYLDLGGNLVVDIPYLNNVSATNAASNTTAGSTIYAGLNVDADVDVAVTELISENTDFSDAGMRNLSGVATNSADAVNVSIDTQTVPATISFADLTADDATGKGVDIELIDVTGGDSSVTLTNVSAQNADRGEGLDLDITGLGATDTITVNVTNADFSGAGTSPTYIFDDVNLLLQGVAGSMATLNFDGLTATDAMQDGIDLALQSGITATVGTFNTVTAQQNSVNGLKIDVSGGSKLTDFVADVLDFSNNGTGGFAGDGLDVMVRGAGSTATFNLSTLTVNDSGGRGIDLDVFDNASLTFNITDGTIDGSGLQGLDINVASQDESIGGSPAPTISAPATFAGTFNEVDVLNSGQSPTFAGDGIEISATGAGTSVTATFDDVSSDSNDGYGFDIDVNNGTTGTFAIENGSTASNNVLGGFSFAADGATTQVSLVSQDGALGGNVFDGNQGGPGFEVNLTNGVTVTNLSVSASANNNTGGDGVRVVANDGTGVTINTFDITGAGLTVNNNAGNGLYLDFNQVTGITSFALVDMTVSGNTGDQVFASFENMSLTDVSLTNLTVTGTTGSDDGIELDLIGSDVTNEFTVDNVTSTANGGHGFNLVADDSAALNSSSIADGLIQNNSFSSNTGAGFNAVLGGDGTYVLDIIDNTTGFASNGEQGINIELESTSVLTVDNFYNNNIQDNGGIGFRFVATELLPANTPTDGIGPVYTLNLGDASMNPNTITGNVDAAIAIEGQNDSVGSLTVENLILTDTIDGSSTDYNGDGLAVLLTGNAELLTLTIDGGTAGLNMNDNEGSGLKVDIRDNSLLGTTSRMTVVNTTFSGNDLHGIDIDRSDNALFGPDAANDQIIIGQAGQGNTFSGNDADGDLDGNGIDIRHRNMPGGPDPLEVQITANTFTGNADGIFIHEDGNAQLVGQITDNVFDSQNQDDIHIRLDEQAALGDPDDAASTPFLIEGNQITGTDSGRYGIYIDTNFTVESPPQNTGNAFANVLITGSANNPRTLISGKGSDGIHICDESALLNSTAVAQNTYQVTYADILSNGGDGINMNVGTNNEVSTFDLDAGAALIVGDASAADNTNVIIAANAGDGLDMTVEESDYMQANLTVQKTTIGDNPDTVDADGNGSNGVRVEVSNEGLLIANFTDVDVLRNGADGFDFDIASNYIAAGFTRTTAEPANVTMYRVNASENAERGLDVRLTHDIFGYAYSTNSSVKQGTTSVWNIGGTDIYTETNRFNNNGREGVVFDLQATGIDTDTRHNNNTPSVGDDWDINEDVYVQPNLTWSQTRPTQYRPSTDHLLITNGIVGGGTLGEETRQRIIADINFINNQVSNNGQDSTNSVSEDGVVLAVGSMTRLNVNVSGNSFGGNAGQDLKVYSQRSSDLNPPDSYNSDTSNQVNYIVYDPVAYVDMVFGAIDTDGDDIPDTVLGDGLSALADYDLDGTLDAGDGNQIFVTTFGDNSTADITNDGVYTNNDPVKGDNRPVRLAGQIQVFDGTLNNGGFDDETVNNFVENGTQQTIDDEFTYWIWNPAQIFPESSTTFPP